MSAIAEELQAAVKSASRVWRVSRDSILSDQRPKRVCKARFAVYAWMRRKGYVYEQIGLAMGKDHGAVMSGVRKFRNWIETVDSMKIDAREFALEMGVGEEELSTWVP